MGCQPQTPSPPQIISLPTESSFKLSVRELVTQDRGQVFDIYQFSNIISRSGYSIVRRVVRRSSGMGRVCKIVPLGDREYFQVLGEVQFLKKLDHPNIVQIIEYFLDSSYLYIILQQIPGNRILLQLKSSTPTGLKFQTLVEILRQILSALDFCHRKNIAHRGIGIENVMLIWQDGLPIVKIVGFGQAMVLGCPRPLAVDPGRRAVGFGKEEYWDGEKLDVFDCGYLIYCLLLGHKPPRVDDNKEILPNCLKTIQSLNLPPQIETDLKSLLTQMLSLSPASRPPLSQCLQHAFFKNFSRKTEMKVKKSLQNLMQFQPENNLTYLLSMYSSLNMVSTLNRAQYIMQFYNLDTNRDGEIQLEQLRAGLINTFNISPQKAQEYAESVFTNLDKNRSSSLNFSEFVTGTMKLSKIYTVQSLQLLFNEMDTNKDGSISEKELNNLIAGIDRCNLLEGKREVCFQEFRDIMMRIFRDDQKK